MTILAIVFDLLVCIGLPMAVLVWCIARRRQLVLPFAAGVLTFLFSQLLTRIPLMQWLGGQLWFVAFTATSPLLWGLLAALTAGLFEETGRYIAMTLMKHHRGYPQALAFGVGHGGLEAAVLLGGALIVLIIQDPGQIAALPAGSLLLGGVERLLAMVLQVGLSVMVMRSVQRKKPLGLVMAIAVHTAIDLVSAVLLPMAGAGAWVIEGVLAAMTLAMLGYILWAHKVQALVQPAAPGQFAALSPTVEPATDTEPSNEDEESAP